MKAKTKMGGLVKMITSIFILTVILSTQQSFAYTPLTGNPSTGDHYNKVTDQTSKESSAATVKVKRKDVSVELEEEILLEDWMFDVNDRFWKNSKEEEILLEDWMFDTDNAHWRSGNTEEDIELEDWMLDLASWK